MRVATKQDLIDVLSKAVDQKIIPGMSFDESRTLSILDVNGRTRATIECYKNLHTLVLQGGNIVTYFANIELSTTHPRFKNAMCFSNLDGVVQLYVGNKHATA